MYSPIDGYLGYFQFLAPANNAATSNYVKCPSGTWGKVSRQWTSTISIHLNCLRAFKSLSQAAPSPIKFESLEVGTRHLYF